MRNPKIEKEIRAKWKPRPRRANKKDFGRVLILAGSRGLSGAASLAAFAALRAGAGLVTLGCPEAIYPALARPFPEVMVRPLASTRQGTLAFKAWREIKVLLENQDVIGFGPGLSRNPETQKLIRHLIQTAPRPLVIDADAVNALEGYTGLLKKRRQISIVTPHPGEFVRAFSGKKPLTDTERRKRAAAVAEEFGIILVLKGWRTVVANPEGKIFVNTTGNPGMATGGTGDVLTGIIAALVGQGLDPFGAARFGVYLHGLAGDLAATAMGEVSLVAGDIVQFLPQALQSVLK